MSEPIVTAEVSVEMALRWLKEDPDRSIIFGGLIWSRASLNAIVLSFADDCFRMIESLRVASFPIPQTIRVSVGVEAADADLVIEENTARVLHAALGRALGFEPTISVRGDR